MIRMTIFASLLVASLLVASGCASRSYTHYLLRPAPKKSPVMEEEEGTLVRPLAFGSTTVMKVRWNDGDTLTEVHVPMLASGQRIVVEHGKKPEGVESIPETRLVPPPPTLADEVLVDAYRQRGLAIDEAAPEVSISRARSLMNDALEAGNYQIALEWASLVLKRYKSHPEFMRAKASILLLMGERDKAIEIYQAVEEIESDPAVRKKLEELQSEDR